MYLAYSYSGDWVDKRQFFIFILCNYIWKDLGIASQIRRAVCTPPPPKRGRSIVEGPSKWTAVLYRNIYGSTNHQKPNQKI